MVKHQFKFSIFAAIKSLRILWEQHTEDGMWDRHDFYDAARPCKGCGLTFEHILDQIRMEQGCAWHYVNSDMNDDCIIRRRKQRLKGFW